MPDIHIHRAHTLGLDRARELARAWAEDAERRFELRCTLAEGDAADSVAFKRSGVAGTLTVAAGYFDLQAELGFLLAPFRKRIEGEIEQQFDALLAGGASGAR